MDWEKKTAQREALREAAADTFNDMITPGQAFLQSLQVSSRTSRAQGGVPTAQRVLARGCMLRVGGRTAASLAKAPPAAPCV